MKILLTLALLPTLAFAAGTNRLTWVLPTVNIDGVTPIDPITAVNVYKGTKPDGSDLVLVTSLKSATATSWTDSNVTLPRNCYAVSITTTVEGGKSPVACDGVASARSNTRVQRTG